MQNIKTPDSTNDDFAYSIKNLIENIINSKINTILPGEIVMIENGKEVAVRSLVIEKESTHPPVVFYNVPVVMPGGSTSSFHYPLRPGDQGVLLTCKKDITLFKSTRKASKTQTQRTFDSNDSIFMPLLFKSREETLDGEEVKLSYMKTALTLQENEVTIETKSKVTIKNSSATIIIDQDNIKITSDKEIDITSPAVKINCDEITCPPLKESQTAILQLLDALANGMVGSGTNATMYRAERPTKDLVFAQVK